jgi:radical SAM protein with 4Fe4S-binding SPASM domain
VKTNFSLVPKIVKQNPGMAANMALSFLTMKKANVIDRRYRKTTSKELALIYFRITPLCNLKCVMCGQRGVKGVLKGKHAFDESKKIVPIERYYKLVDEVAPKKPVFYMWGGEPFMYPGFMDLAEYISKSGCLLSVNTNGTFLAENAERIVQNKWHGIFVSLDGFEEVNDSIRGKGSYRRVIDGFKAINEAKKKHNTNLPYMGVVTTVSKFNYLYLHDLAIAAADFGLSWHIINLGTYTNDEVVERHREFMRKELDTEITCLPAYNTGFNEDIDGEKFKEILKKVHATDNGYPIITVPVIDPDKIGEYYSDLDAIVRDNCVVPWSQANIDYNGDVHFCADYPDYTLGNIMDDSFFNIYNNERSQRFRSVLKNSPNGLFPGCVRCYQNMLCGRRCPGY